MNDQTIITLLVLLTFALVLLTAFFGTAIYKTVKFNRNTKLMNQQAKESQEAFAELNRNLAALNN
jgi:uncharacterized membrane protein